MWTKTSDLDRMVGAMNLLHSRMNRLFTDFDRSYGTESGWNVSEGTPKTNMYDLGDKLLLVVSDRVSAFDVVLPNGIPGKGKKLTEVSTFWFGMMKDIVPNHILATEVKDFPAELQKYGDMLEGRSILVKKTKVMPVELALSSAWA